MSLDADTLKALNDINKNFNELNTRLCVYIEGDQVEQKQILSAILKFEKRFKSCDDKIEALEKRVTNMRWIGVLFFALAAASGVAPYFVPVLSHTVQGAVQVTAESL